LSIDTEKDAVKLAKTAIIAFGLISLFGDIIYEGARGSIPAYLEVLATPAVIVGLAIGLGEFLGYALRLASGYVADTTKAYWTLTIIGYGLIISIPLLALTYDWRFAVVLIIAERIGKAIRTPARDTLISVTTKGIGRGKAFGLHELFDQIGATVGPLLMAIILYKTAEQGKTPIEQFHTAFLFLFIPYMILIIVLLSGYLKMKSPAAEALQTAEIEKPKEELSRPFYLYSIAVMMNTAGLFHIALILYISTGLMPESLWLIPILYLLVQGIDAASAPISGAAYDKHGIKVLSIPFILSILPTIFIASIYTNIVPLTPTILIIASVITFGIILGMQESIYRAAVADLTGITKRGTGYGIFNTAYGLGFLISGTIIGYIIDKATTTPSYMLIAVIYTIVLQATALILLKTATKAKQ